MSEAPYNRDDWKLWGDADCQDTRAEVLIEEGLIPVRFHDSRCCVVNTAHWVDPYTGQTVTVAADLDIDHLSRSRMPIALEVCAGRPRCCMEVREGDVFRGRAR
jgi:hypothetical protein